jgi:hypothetical protein
VAHQRIILPKYGLEMYGDIPAFVSHAYSLVDGLIRLVNGGDLHPPTPIVVMHLCLEDEDLEAMSTARRNGQIVVIDFDDDYWNIPQTNVARDVFGESAQHRLVESIRLADAVTVSTDRLHALIDHPRKAVLRNTVRFAAFARLPVRKDPPVLRLGYAGLVDFHHDDVLLLKGWLDDWLTEHGAKLVHLGHRQPLNLFDLLGIRPANRAESIPLVDLFEYPQVLARCRFDIGLVPLADNEFNDSKSDLKGLEYAAAGIPFLATRAAEYQRLGPEIARPIEEWPSALEELIGFDARLQRVESGLKWAKENDIATRWVEYRDFYRSLL